MKVKELIEYGKKLLNENKIEDNNIKSRILAQFILNMNRQEIVVNSEKEITEEQKHRYYLALIEVIQGMPVQYITNKQEFMKMEFYVDENVLIPQPDTENLVEETIKITKTMEEKIDVLDICTGSGCIGTSIAKNIENLNSITMSDISNKAIKIAEKNFKNNVENVRNAEFIESDMFEKINKKYDIIISNPPYIETQEIEELPEEVKQEPHLALDGGKEGIDYYKILTNEAHKYLKEKGYLCMEIGYNQKESVEELLKESEKYTNIKTIKDLSGNDRVVICSKK